MLLTATKSQFFKLISRYRQAALQESGKIDQYDTELYKQSTV
jgi:hypothetical protein